MSQVSRQKFARTLRKNSCEFSVDVTDIFYFFFALGRGRGSPRRGEGGNGFLLKISGGGGVSWAGGGLGGGRGAGRVFARNWGGGGLNIFFRGRNSDQGISVGSAISLRLGCYRIQKPLKSGNTKKIRKNYKITHLRFGPENG